MALHHCRDALLRIRSDMGGAIAEDQRALRQRPMSRSRRMSNLVEVTGLSERELRRLSSIAGQGCAICSNRYDHFFRTSNDG